MIGLGRVRYLAALLLVALSCSVAAAPPRKVLIDDDVIGLNGVLPLLLGASDVEVLGITTTSGSVWRDTATAHALRTLEIAGRTDVPVVPGAILPLLNSQEQTRRWEGLHGRLVFKGPWTDYWPKGTVQDAPAQHAPDYVPPLPEGKPTTKPAAGPAALFLIEAVRRDPHEIALIATGPMTNIALAISLDPTFAANVKELVYMGGSLNPQQRLASVSAEQFGREYVNSPRREFNVRWDPEAARIVAHAAFSKVVMIPVDPSTGTEWTRAFLDRVGRTGTPLARAVAATVQPGFPMWDELAAVTWLHPEVIARATPLFIDYEIGGGGDYGDTRSWTSDYRPNLGEHEQLVVREIDRERLQSVMLKLYASRSSQRRSSEKEVRR